MENFKKAFKTNKPIIGMIHLDPLTATPKYKNNNNEIIEKALKEADIYKKAGIDSISIENMHDIPYIKNQVGHEISSIMSIIAYQIKKMTNLPCGIQILAGANKEAMAVAKSANLDFIRAEGFVFAHVADEGIIESCAGDLLRYRKQIDANDILIFTDIKKKHSSHSITSDVDIIETAHAAEFFLSDGVIVTGVATGFEASPKEIEEVKNNVKIPVLVGSGVTLENVDSYLKISDALIVGSYFKKDGNWINTVDYDRTSIFMEKVNTLRNNYK